MLLTLFFTLKTVSRGSIIASIFNNKFVFIIMYGIFTFFIVLGLGLKYGMNHNIFPVWLIIFSLVFLFCIIFIAFVYIALKISNSSKLKIYQAPGSTNREIPHTIVLEDIIQVEGGVEGEVLEDVRFFPGTNIVRSYKYPDYFNGGRSKKIFIESNKIHYNRDNICYLKGNLVPSRDPRYDIEVSMMGFDQTKDMHDLAEKVDYYKNKYYTTKDMITDITDAFKNMGTHTKGMSDAMGEGVKHLLEKVNVQMRGQTDWERKGQLEQIGLSKKDIRRYEDVNRQLDDLKKKGAVD